MTGLSAIRGQTVYDLNDAQKYLWMADDGLGMVPLHRLVERGPQQHGATDKGFLLDPRVVKLVIGLFGEDDGDYWATRDQLLRIFKPSNTPIKLLFTLPNGALRQIDLHYSGDMSFPSNDRSRIAHKTGILLTCPEPTFYDPTGLSITYGIGGGSSGFQVPLAIPMSVGSSNLGQTKTINYNGSWMTFPTIRIKGPITDPVVTNVTLGEELNFTGTTIAAGDYYDIDLSYSEKTVLDSAGVNRFDKLTDGSDGDITTFRIEADPDAPGGANDIRVTGSGVTSASEVYIALYERFIGM